MFQTRSALDISDKNALIIIDEFGKGTSEIDATSLLAATIIDFSNRVDECPHVFIVTHFHEIMKWIPQDKLIKLQVRDPV